MAFHPARPSLLAVVKGVVLGSFYVFVNSLGLNVVVVDVTVPDPAHATFRAHDTPICALRWHPCSSRPPISEDAMDIDTAESVVLLTASAHELRMWNVASNSIELEGLVSTAPAQTAIAGFDLSPNGLMAVIVLWYADLLVRVCIEFNCISDTRHPIVDFPRIQFVPIATGSMMHCVKAMQEERMQLLIILSRSCTRRASG